MTSLESALAEVARLTEEREEILALLGHELRNPLAPIVAALELLRMRGASGRELDVIERHVHHLRVLVSDLLDVSRLARGTVTLDRRAIDLTLAIEHALEASEELIEEREHAVTVECSAELRVSADRDRLVQILTNLVANAAKYTPARGSISVHAASSGDTVVIRVKDNGRGLSPAVLARLFQPFAQHQQGVARAHGGLGLGLAIVKNLVELHGGSVSATSDGDGKGTEVTVTLPAAEETQTAHEPRPAPRRPQRVLIVDDNVDAAETLADMLRLLGHEVVVVHDGPSALDVVEAAKPHIALVDIGMPVMDGYELAQRLRQLPIGKVSLVALTGYGSERERERALGAGFDHHLVKPLDPDLLAKLLDDDQ